MRNYDAFAGYDAWRRWRQGDEPDRPTRRAVREPVCPLCAGTCWIAVPDPFFNGALVDQRCPACCDLTVRADTSRWEDNTGRKVGPT